MSKPKINAEELSEAEHQWLTDQRTLCTQIISELNARPINGTPSISQLSEAFDIWIDQFQNSLSKRKWFTKKSEPIDPNTIALAFGVLLGDHILAATQLEWKIVTDEFGTELMLFANGLEGKYTDIVTAPIGMVAKRIEQRAEGWLEPTYTDLVEDLQCMMQ